MKSITVKGTKAELAKVRKQINNKAKAKQLPVAYKLASALADATPKDTGRASEGWEVAIEAGKVVVKNDVPYIDELNRGHSKQAPAFFIEQTVLENKDVVPVGAIVSYR